MIVKCKTLILLVSKQLGMMMSGTTIEHIVVGGPVDDSNQLSPGSVTDQSSINIPAPVSSCFSVNSIAEQGCDSVDRWDRGYTGKRAGSSCWR